LFEIKKSFTSWLGWVFGKKKAAVTNKAAVTIHLISFFTYMHVKP
jgi:hypothetical protein